MDANLRLTRSQVLVSALVGLGLATGGFVTGWHLSRRPMGFGSTEQYFSHKVSRGAPPLDMEVRGKLIEHRIRKS
jgi:hypothetical protein